MPPVQPKAPRFSSDELEPCDLSEIELRAEADWSHLLATGLASGLARDAIFDEIEWQAARLGAVNWERATWRDSRFFGCDLAGARATRIAVTRVEFSECRVKGSAGRRERLERCRVPRLQFGGRAFAVFALETLPLL